MFKKIYFFLGVLICLYLLLPPPRLPPPDLPSSLKSDEPGDTVQMSHVAAYYSNASRQEIILFYKKYFSRSSFLNLPLPVVTLNHPPEYAKQVFRDTMRSYYLEELIHPLRESLFVNGFEWSNDVFTPADQRAQNAMIVGGREWTTKVSLRWFYSSMLVRIIIFFSSWLAGWWLLKNIGTQLSFLFYLICRRRK